MRNTLASRVIVGLLLTGAIGLSASACRREERALGTTAAVEAAVARDRIAEARCDLEQKCNKIGVGKDYADRNACTAKIKQRWQDELNFRDCPGGIDTKELNECLTEIRNNNCGNPLDTLGRIMACRSSDLCLHVR